MWGKYYISLRIGAQAVLYFGSCFFLSCSLDRRLAGRQYVQAKLASYLATLVCLRRCVASWVDRLVPLKVFARRAARVLAWLAG